MTEHEPEREPGELDPTTLASNPRALLDRQAQQLAVYDAAVVRKITAAITA